MIGWEIKLSYSNSLRYYLLGKCCESVHVTSHGQSLGSCGADLMLLERGSRTWNII